MTFPRAILAAIALLCAMAAPAEAHWRWPARGRVVQRFELGPDRFARGQHRGIDLAAPAGAAVTSACAGRVTFAGAVGRDGRTVSVRCGGLVATYQRLGTIDVGRGDELAPGGRVGTIAATGRPLYFGVHHAVDRHAYVDPLSLLGEDASPTPPLIPLSPRGPGPTAAPPPLGPGPSPAPAARPRSSPLRPPAARMPAAPMRAPAAGLHARTPAGSGVPTVAWIGLGLAVLALPGWGIERRRRRHRSVPQAPKTLASSASLSRWG
jgi:Peptidase family M23